MPPELVLSLFPGIDLLGRGFEEGGFCVVRGPDVIWGGDIFNFHPVPGKFDGVIGGSPCQNISTLNRHRNLADAARLIGEFIRCVREAQPGWWLLENVVGVPTVTVPGYQCQRFNLRASECGGRQRRNRVFQFGSRDGSSLVCDRSVTRGPLEKIALASESSRAKKRGWPDFCELQGLPRNYELPGMNQRARYRAVGNGVHLGVARVLCQAVLNRHRSRGATLCACGCGRVVVPKRKGHVCATVSCRKRIQPSRIAQRDATWASLPGAVTA